MRRGSARRRLTRVELAEEVLAALLSPVELQSQVDLQPPVDPQSPVAPQSLVAPQLVAASVGSGSCEALHCAGSCANGFASRQTLPSEPSWQTKPSKQFMSLSQAPTQTRRLPSVEQRYPSGHAAPSHTRVHTSERAQYPSGSARQSLCCAHRVPVGALGQAASHISMSRHNALIVRAPRFGSP